MAMKNIKKLEAKLKRKLKRGFSVPKVYKAEKFAMDKFKGKKNPPRLLTYGEFVDLVEERRGRAGEEFRG